MADAGRRARRRRRHRPVRPRPTYLLTFAAIVLSGIGVAAFHPEAARHANYASGAAKARGMSLFALGGNAGFALGPVLTTAACSPSGLRGTLLVALVPAMAGATLLAKRGAGSAPSGTAAGAAAEARREPRRRTAGARSPG